MGRKLFQIAAGSRKLIFEMKITTNSPKQEPASQVKTIILAVLAGLSSAFAAWTLARLGHSDPLDVQSVTIAMLIFAASFAWQIFLWSILALAKIESLGYLLITLGHLAAFFTSAVLFQSPSEERNLFITAGISSFYSLICLFYISSIKSRLNDYIKFHPWWAYPPSIKASFIAISFLASVNFFLGYNQLIKNGGFKIPQDLIKKIMEPGLNFVQNQLGNQINNMFGEKINQKLGVSGEQGILEFMKQESIETLEDGANARIDLGITPQNIGLDQVGISPEGKLDVTPMVDKVSDNVIKMVEDSVNNYLGLVAPIAALSIFLSLCFFGSIITQLLTFAITGGFWFFEKISLVNRTKHMEEVERLEL